MANLIPPPPIDPEWALFVDVDGTLLEIAPEPDAVHVPEHLPSLLQRLQNNHGGALALISGRPIAALDRLFRPWHGAAAGLHGGERRRPDGSCVANSDEEAAATLDRIRPAAAALAARAPGIGFEDKGRALALHYRGAPRRASEVAGFAQQAVAESGQSLRAIAGKLVMELVPRGYGKGRAVAAFLAEPPFRGRIPAFLGDDVTDEEGFAEVARHQGVAIRVGPADAETAAQYALPDVGTALAWLASG
jgi:trehalose 6-phosphate phosphatase